VNKANKILETIKQNFSNRFKEKVQNNTLQEERATTHAAISFFHDRKCSNDHRQQPAATAPARSSLSLHVRLHHQPPHPHPFTCTLPVIFLFVQW